MVHVSVVQVQSFEADVHIHTKSPHCQQKDIFRIDHNESAPILLKRKTSEVTSAKVGHNVFITQTVRILLAVAIEHFL